MDLKDKVVAKAIKEIQGSLGLSDKQTAYIKHFLYCIYELGKRENVERPMARKPVEMLYGNIVLAEYESEKQAAIKTGYSASTICKYIRTKGKTDKGHRFRFKTKKINTSWLE